jgi:GT2 family glycosyltransferase
LQDLQTLFDPEFYRALSGTAGEASELSAHYAAHGDALGLAPHPLFDPGHYGRQLPELPATGGARLRHFLEHGGHDGSSPHPLFQSQFYLDQSPELRGSTENLLLHYLGSGEELGRKPNPLFDPAYYLETNPDLAVRHTPLLIHYLLHGTLERRNPNPLFLEDWYRQHHLGGAPWPQPLAHYLEQGDEQGLSPCPLFDGAYYGEQNPDLEPRLGARLAHFLEHRGRDGSNPHPLFHSHWYRDQCDALASSGENPLVHYLREGERLGLTPNPLFDPAVYLAANPDLAGLEISSLIHYLDCGGREGRTSSALFDAPGYLARHPRLALEGGNPLADYFRHSARNSARNSAHSSTDGGSIAAVVESPHPLFDPTWYCNTYDDVAASGLSPIAHFVRIGMAEGRDPNPLFDSAWYAGVYAGWMHADDVAFVHYLGRGQAANLCPNPLFDPVWYVENYDVALRPGEGPLTHYIREGWKQGHRPSPLFDFCLHFLRSRDPAARARLANPAAGYFVGDFARFSCPEVEAPIVLPDARAPEVSVVIPMHGQLSYTLACLRSLSRAETQISHEVIVVDDASPEGAGVGETLGAIENLRVIRSDENEGFVEACNRGVAVARGREIVLLNNDTLVADDWLDRLLETRDAFPNAGLVGARLVYPSGLLQESGGIVFRDGSAANYGNRQDPLASAFSYARACDYVSAACVLISKALFDELGGLDTAFAPAFYEDTDLAFRVREAGHDVVVQPSATLVHFGGASYGTDPARGLKRHQEGNRETFRRRWDERLQEHFPRSARADLAARRLAGRRALVIDAAMLKPDQDSGSLRMFNMIRVLQRLGYSVSFAPSNLAAQDRYAQLLERNGVEVVRPPDYETLSEYLEKAGNEFELCILSRPLVAERWLETVRLLCPRASVLYDTVDLHFLRREREIDVCGESALPASTKEEELRACRRADAVLAVSAHDRERLAREDPQLEIHVVSNIHELHPSAVPFEEREGILFVGGFRHEPNGDAIVWFAREVMPLINQALPDVRLRIVGSEMPDEVRQLAGDRVLVEGYVPDLTDILDHARVSIAPLRYGSGVKGKVNQSMSHGLPCVVTSVAAEGMEAKPGLEIVIADGAVNFAQAVVKVYQDPALWQRLAANSLQNIERTFSMQAAERALAAVLSTHGAKG